MPIKSGCVDRTPFRIVEASKSEAPACRTSGENRATGVGERACTPTIAYETRSVPEASAQRKRSFRDTSLALPVCRGSWRERQTHTPTSHDRKANQENSILVCDYCGVVLRVKWGHKSHLEAPKTAVAVANERSAALHRAGCGHSGLSFD